MLRRRVLISASGVLRNHAFAALVICAFAGCSEREPVEVPAILELDGDTVRLAAGARVIDVGVSRPEDGVEFEPAFAQAVPGDVIRFRARDEGPHALVFDIATSDTAAVAFLNDSDQLRGLPFLQTGAEWVITLDAAPVGRFVTRCLTHGETMTIRVNANRTGRDG